MKTRLGHYDIVAELGRGGMGVVYKGHESSLNRYVAIKVLADSLAHDEGVKERFLREARSMAALNDPHIIQIYYIGDDEGQTYFVMEFVEGESLGTLLKREHKVAVGPAAKIIYQTALGLATAHDKGVIHRDIKPGNLMVSSRGSIKIADFGIALSNQDISKKLTSTGEFVGTPGLSVARGLPRQAGRPPLRHLLARHRAVRDAGRTHAVHRRIAARPHARSRARRDSRRARAQRRGRRADRLDPVEDDRQGTGRSLPELPRAGRGSARASAGRQEWPDHDRAEGFGRRGDPDRPEDAGFQRTPVANTRITPSAQPMPPAHIRRLPRRQRTTGLRTPVRARSARPTRAPNAAVRYCRSRSPRSSCSA